MPNVVQVKIPLQEIIDAAIYERFDVNGEDVDWQATTKESIVVGVSIAIKYVEIK